MINIYQNLLNNPAYYRQFTCGESLITLYNCPLKTRYQDVWSQHNYFIYVVEGYKNWHTPHGTYELSPGSCVFVRKGAAISEQVTYDKMCLVMLFMPDDFICGVLKSKTAPVYRAAQPYQPVMMVENNLGVELFFQSMMAYFNARQEPDKYLLELKFRELILTVADNPLNREVLSFFCALLHQPQSVTLQHVMENNYCFNLKLEEFAQLANRSLSAFKRDFQQQFNTTPGKWLLEKRLQHARHLLTNMGKTVSEAAFESGFESPSHFSRSFNARFGSAPNTVRKMSVA